MRTVIALFAVVTAVVCTDLTVASADSRSLGATGLGDNRPNDRCAELIKECFAYNGNEKSSCFNVSAKHPFCVGTELGALAGKRWTMSPQTDFRDAPPALTGPQFIDGECIANVDSQWSGHLIGGTLTREAIHQLETTLDSCAKAPANEIFRP